MKNFQKNKRFYNVLQSKFFLTLLGIIIIFFIFNLFKFMEKTNDTFENKRRVEDRIDELNKSKDKFNKDISNLNTDKGIEENIRQKFGLAKEGENMILIVDDKPEPDIKKDNNNNVFLSFFTNLFK